MTLDYIVFGRLWRHADTANDRQVVQMVCTSEETEAKGNVSMRVHDLPRSHGPSLASNDPAMGEFIFPLIIGAATRLIKIRRASPIGQERPARGVPIR
jgi:hypothetical protein